MFEQAFSTSHKESCGSLLSFVVLLQTSPYRRQQNTSHAPSTTGLSPLMLRTAVGHQPQNIRDYPQPPPRQQHASGRAHHRDDTDTLGGERRPQVSNASYMHTHCTCLAICIFCTAF